MGKNDIQIQIGEADVKKGYAEVPIQVDSNIGNGEYELLAIYMGDEYYMPSQAVGKIRVGYASMCHCPWVFVWEMYKTNTILTAHVYIGTHQASVGRGVFSVMGTPLDEATPLYVKSGKATKIYDSTMLDDNSSRNRMFNFRYFGSYDTKIKTRNINPSTSPDARIIFMRQNSDLIKNDHVTTYPTIEIEPICGKAGETVTVRMRVYNRDYGTTFDKSDIPTGKGTFRFWYEGMSESEAFTPSSTVDTNGYCNITFTLPNYEDGAYNFFGKFVPNGNSDWAGCYGCTSMFITSYTPNFSEPTLTITDISFNKGERNAYITCKFDPPYIDGVAQISNLRGVASLQLDDVNVQLTNSQVITNDNIQQIPVDVNGRCEFQFSLAQTDNSIWKEPGTHRINVIYTINQTGETFTYYTDARLIIRKTTACTIENVNDNDSIIYLPNGGTNTAIRVRVDDLDTQSVISEGNVLIKYVKSEVTN